MAIPRIRPGNYPAVLSYGFRPFFLFGSIWGALCMLLWIPMLSGTLETRSLFLPVDWHVHEVLFGYLGAILAGFLLTAIPNWTGRLPVQGAPLAVLVLLWLVGRVAVFISADTGWVIAMIADSLFLLAMAGAAAIEIVAGRNWRNLKVLLPVVVFLAANVLFHVEAHFNGAADVSRRLGLSAALVLIMLIGGRIIPSFTRNWLTRVNPGRLPVPFNRFDMAVIVFSAAALLCWTFWPESSAAGGLLIVAAALNLVRMVRWAGDRTLRDPLVLVLHVAYLFVPFGMLVTGLGMLTPDLVPSAAGIHLFGVGAIGAMTLAVMTRATLGHTGRPLVADGSTCVIYGMIILAALVRLAAVFLPDVTMLVHVAGTLWVGAFAVYALRYGSMLMRPRLGAH